MKALDYGTPFRYPFEDKAWPRKLLLASLLTYTLVGAAPVLGWTIAAARQVARGGSGPLPALTDWKTNWRLGGRLALAGAVWLLPLLAAVLLLYLPAALADRLRPETFLAVFGGIACCLGLFLTVYSGLYVFFTPAMLVVLAGGGSAWQAVNPVRLWREVRPRLSAYLAVFLVVGLGLYNLAFLLGALSLFLLLPPLLVYTGLVGAHFAGQLAQCG
jgi:hypothetical protein